MRDHQRFEFRRHARGLDRLAGRLDQLEPEKPVGCQRDHIGLITNRWKVLAPEHFAGDAAAPWRQIDFGGLRRARQVGNAQQHFVFVLPREDKDGSVGRPDEIERAAAENPARSAHGDQSLRPAQE